MYMRDWCKATRYFRHKKEHVILGHYALPNKTKDRMLIQDLCFKCETDPAYGDISCSMCSLKPIHSNWTVFEYCTDCDMSYDCNTCVIGRKNELERRDEEDDAE